MNKQHCSLQYLSFILHNLPTIKPYANKFSPPRQSYKSRSSPLFLLHLVGSASIFFGKNHLLILFPLLSMLKYYLAYTHSTWYCLWSLSKKKMAVYFPSLYRKKNYPNLKSWDSKLVMVSSHHATREVETGEMQVQDQPKQNSKFQAILGQ